MFPVFPKMTPQDSGVLISGTDDSVDDNINYIEEEEEKRERGRTVGGLVFFKSRLN